MDEEDRIDYGRTLLDFSVQSDALPGGLQLSTAVAGGKKQLKERLQIVPVSVMGIFMTQHILESLPVAFYSRRQIYGRMKQAEHTP